MAKPKKPKATEPEAVNLGHNLGVDPDKRALFLIDLKQWQKLDKAAKDAAAKRREHEKQIKEDGFLIAQVKLGALLATPEGEEEFRDKTASLLTAAQYVGAAIGTQLALFLSPDRTTTASIRPLVDVAYDLGVGDCIAGKVARSPYEPLTEQSQSYFKGFADEQERRLKAGITKLEPAKGYIPMTAEEFAKQQAEAKAAGAKH